MLAPLVILFASTGEPSADNVQRQLAPLVILIISTALQYAAAVLAIRLMRITGRKWAWGLVAVGIAVMAIRRSILLYGALSGDLGSSLDLHLKTLELVLPLACLPAWPELGRFSAPLAGLQSNFATPKRNWNGACRIAPRNWPLPMLVCSKNAICCKRS